MNKLAIYSIICLIWIFITIPSGTSTGLQCYQCNPVTQECEDNKADVITCGSVSTSRCSRQVKKGSSDPSKALRKCVIPDTYGKVSCPIDYDCYNCDEDLCNSNPIMTTSAPPNSAFSLKFTWSLGIATFAIIYL